MKVEDDAPNRCQASTTRGQCRSAVMPNTNFCSRHGGAQATRRMVRESRRKYQLAAWQERVGNFADDGEIKNLNEEVGILRMTLENVVLACNSSTDILLWSPKIADLVAKIERIVTTLHKLEASTGVLLSREATFELADKIIEIVGKYVTDADVTASIADEIGTAIAELKTEDPEI